MQQPHTYIKRLARAMAREPKDRYSDMLELHVNVIKSRGPVWRFNGVAKVGATICAQSDFSAMIVDPPERPAESGPR